MHSADKSNPTIRIAHILNYVKNTGKFTKRLPKGASFVLDKETDAEGATVGSTVENNSPRPTITSASEKIVAQEDGKVNAFDTAGHDGETSKKTVEAPVGKRIGNSLSGQETSTKRTIPQSE